LAEKPVKLGKQVYATPHPGEAATLLGISTSAVESDRIAAIYALQKKYAGQWVLKGSGSLILDTQLWICTAGNPGMGTGGMGDVLAGMIASLKAQLQDDIALHQIVILHAQAGDLLAHALKWPANKLPFWFERSKRAFVVSLCRCLNFLTKALWFP